MNKELNGTFSIVLIANNDATHSRKMYTKRQLPHGIFKFILAKKDGGVVVVVGWGAMQISAAAAVSSVTHSICPLSLTTEIVKSSTTVPG